jgi:hypothetical protein
VDDGGSAAAAAHLAGQLRPDRTGPVAQPRAGWAPVLDLAAAHLLLPAVWAELARRGVRPLPPELRADPGEERPPLQVLEEAYDKNRDRTVSVEAELAGVLQVLHDAGVEAMPIKGAHWLAARWLADPAARTMVDIDVLVDPGRAGRARSALEEVGYRQLTVEEDEWADHQLPPLVPPDQVAAVELHTSPLWSLHGAVLPAEELWASARVIDLGDLAVPVPTTTDAATLLVAHAQLHDLGHRFGRLPLRALHDLAALGNEGRWTGVDWDVVSERFARVGAGRALAAFATVADEWFGVSLPVERLGGRRWMARAQQALDQPRRADRRRRLTMVGVTFGAARMDRLYGTSGPIGRNRARTRHLMRGIGRRLGRDRRP